MNAKAGELDPAEWDFSNVPKEELEACFLWEYARESAWLRRMRERCLADLQRKRNRKSVAALEEDIGLLMGAIHYDSTAVLSKFFYWPDEQTSTGIFWEPWQSMPKTERWNRADIGEELRPSPFSRGHLFRCDEIYDAAKPALKKREKLLEDNRIDEWLALNIPSSIQSENGTEEGIFNIEWGRFTDKAIADYFRKWAKASRPANIPEPKKNGDKTENRRAWLLWLGIMRALHRCTLADHRFPQALRAHGEKKIYAMRKKARKKFRELFAFLPEPGEPLSFPSKGKMFASS